LGASTCCSTARDRPTRATRPVAAAMARGAATAATARAAAAAPGRAWWARVSWSCRPRVLAPRPPPRATASGGRGGRRRTASRRGARARVGGASWTTCRRASPSSARPT
ncbi:hypothetical protein BAE44_0016800, partial [Dichanthelium oligosanthes]